MKKFKKIIAFFLFIFLTGIYVTVKNINASLNKTTPKKEIVQMQPDSTSLLKTKKKTL